MTKKTKVIIELSIYVVILLAIILAIFFSLFKITRSYDVIIERNGMEKEATVTLSYNWFAKCRNDLTGTILVETKGGEVVEYFADKNPISFLHDRYFSSGNIWVDEQLEYYHVDVVFDKQLDNIVLFSTEDKYFMYSATEDFLYELRTIREKCAGVNETE